MNIRGKLEKLEAGRRDPQCGNCLCATPEIRIQRAGQAEDSSPGTAEIRVKIGHSCERLQLAHSDSDISTSDNGCGATLRSIT